MDEALQQIGQRLKGLREVLDIPAEEIADLCEISLEHYYKIEDGEADPSVYRLNKIAKRFGIDLNVLMFGEEPNASRYFLCRKGQGVPVDREKTYRFANLAAGFRGRKVEPFLVQVDPLPDGKRHTQNTHEGQEFDMVAKGSLEVVIGNKVLVLERGDSIYFDATQPHCFQALHDRPVVFLALII